MPARPRSLGRPLQGPGIQFIQLHETKQPFPLTNFSSNVVFRRVSICAQTEAREYRPPGTEDKSTRSAQPPDLPGVDQPKVSEMDLNFLKAASHHAGLI